MTGETAACLRFLPFFIFCDGHHGGILSAVFQQVVAAHAERLGQLGDLIIRHEPNALFNAQNGYFVHFHSGKLHARGQLTLGQVLADTQVVQTVHDPSPRF
mgnify:CR=1 FL=1